MTTTSHVRIITGGCVHGCGNTSASDPDSDFRGCDCEGACLDCHKAPRVEATWCPECGPRVAIDEDGCCQQCGNGATGNGAVSALTTAGALTAAMQSLAEANERAASAEAQLALLRDNIRHYFAAELRLRRIAGYFPDVRPAEVKAP